MIPQTITVPYFYTKVHAKHRSSGFVALKDGKLTYISYDEYSPTSITITFSPAVLGFGSDDVLSCYLNVN
jgi:hypothetical protein